MQLDLKLNHIVLCLHRRSSCRKCLSEKKHENSKSHDSSKKNEKHTSVGRPILQHTSQSHVLPIRCANRPVSETGGARTSDLISSSQQNIHIKGNGVSCREVHPAQPHCHRSLASRPYLVLYGSLARCPSVQLPAPQLHGSGTLPQEQHVVTK